ncbi:MAG: NfuA family Fe-S biogenesis protein [Xanthomonadales bacterium]|nr:NfuA family Fe-S biogenesis protein [Gammaproteobacteria bacterium]MBT8054734.1 NfuA family Fe-S biogenesis protein [Gammaproteobacteria bacterium]NND56282.1 NfuA family Fe-S biogenesis protein [Xanthomonadales bacterium]NNK52912.1 NfuA family Fe-S biogenesis protein [Xanthomonadales bacterium]
MIEITESAQTYFRRLIEQQDDDLSLRISVNHAGTPGAGCDLQFCPVGQSMPDDLELDFSGFSLFVARASAPWLEKAQIDFEEDATGGQLTIKAPGIKGSEPSAEASLEDRIGWLLETEVNPALASHGGQVALVEITEKKEVVLQFGGGCQGCGMADVTLKQGIEQTLMRNVPEITAVLDATDHRSGTNPYYAGDASGESAV